METRAPVRYNAGMNGVGPLAWSALIFTFALPAQTADLSVAILEGDGALNSVDARRAREPVVRVERGGRPVAGAVVHFILPAQGPGGSFANGEMSYTASAGEDGVAVARGLRPNRIAGPFEIRVTASEGGETATAVVRQTNVASAEERGARSRKYLWLGVIGGAAAGGILAAMLGGGSEAPVSRPGALPGGGTTVAPGPPSVGPPN